MRSDEYRRMAEQEERHWWYGATRSVVRETLTPLLVPGGRYLDAGGGTGATGAWLGERHRLHVADFFADALDMNRELHPTIEGFAAAEVPRLPYRDHSFDGVLCVTVLCHESIPDTVGAIRELARVVKPGGFVCLYEPGVRRLRRAHDRVTMTGRRFALGDLRRAARSAGLQVERSTGVHAYLVPLAAVKAIIERGRVSSDLDQNETGLGGVLPAVAAAERRLLRRVSLPVGLSVMVLART